MKNSTTYNIKECGTQNIQKEWIKPGFVVLCIKSTFNDQATCAQSNKFTGNSETFGPTGAEITCGPTLS
jgi:hypothetical protein